MADNTSKSFSLKVIEDEMLDIIQELDSVEYFNDEVCRKKIDSTLVRISIVAEKLALYKLLQRLQQIS